MEERRGGVLVVGAGIAGLMAALRAADLCEKPRGGVTANMFRAVRRFYKCYVTRKGYREGEWGVLIALMAALYPLISTLRARLESTQIRSPAATATAYVPQAETRLAKADI